MSSGLVISMKGTRLGLEGYGQVTSVLFTQDRSIYERLGQSTWPQSRDARKYDKTGPVVAHPPCARWCQLAPLNERRYGHRVGDDGGCFASALESVRRCGGVLEHPARSIAWPTFGLTAPSKLGWLQTAPREWVCSVSQAAYGHKARKQTWLLYVGARQPFDLDWSKPQPTHQISERDRHNTSRGVLPALGKREASATPEAFATVLLALAEHSR